MSSHSELRNLKKSQLIQDVEPDIRVNECEQIILDYGRCLQMHKGDDSQCRALLKSYYVRESLSSRGRNAKTPRMPYAAKS